MNLQFVVDTPNNYESAEDAQKIVEMNIIDILYDNKVSNLVYMRDITSYVKQNPLLIAQKEAEDEDLDVEKVTRVLLKSPTIYFKNLAQKVNNEIGIFQNKRDEIIAKLNSIRYDFLLVKNAWDLHSIENKTFKQIKRSFNLKELF